MEKIFYNIFTILAFCLLILSFLLGVLSFKTIRKEQRMFLYYLSFILIIEIITKILVLLKEDNWFLYPFYISGEFFILISMLFLELNIPSKIRILIGVLSILIFYEAIVLWLANENMSSSIGKIVSHITIVCFLGFSLIKSIRVNNIENRSLSLFIYSSLLLYYSVSLFHFLLMSQLTEISKDTAYIIWGTKNIFTCILYGISAYVFFKLRHYHADRY